MIFFSSLEIFHGAFSLNLEIINGEVQIITKDVENTSIAIYIYVAENQLGTGGQCPQMRNFERFCPIEKIINLEIYIRK